MNTPPPIDPDDIEKIYGVGNGIAVIETSDTAHFIIYTRKYIFMLIIAFALWLFFSLIEHNKDSCITLAIAIGLGYVSFIIMHTFHNLICWIPHYFRLKKLQKKSKYYFRRSLSK